MTHARLKFHSQICHDDIMLEWTAIQPANVQQPFGRSWKAAGPFPSLCSGLTCVAPADRSHHKKRRLDFHHCCQKLNEFVTINDNQVNLVNSIFLMPCNLMLSMVSIESRPLSSDQNDKLKIWRTAHWASFHQCVINSRFLLPSL